MCGRIACTLAPDDVCRACGRRATDGRWVQPQWIDSPDGKQYYPSYNLSPTVFSPVLLSTKHVVDRLPEESSLNVDSERVVQPMRWGLIPSWHHGDPSSIEYKMNNARSDGLLSKASFKKPLERGRRCVVLADGYYEWKRSPDGKQKQPYFIYFPQQVSSACSDVEKSEEIKREPEDADLREFKPYIAEEWKGKRLLTMAGIFDVWRPNDDENPLYSYTVITVDAHSSLSWMHDRMPAILNGEEEIRAWLDFESVPLNKALNLVRPADSVQWHAVSSLVNNSRNKSEDCIKPYVPEQSEKKPSASANMMKAWLSAGTKRSSATSDANSETKKQKE